MVWQVTRHCRCAPLLLLTVACLGIGEQFPFSNFPMYSSFGRDTYYVYLADGTGQPLPTIAAAGITTPILKKMYDAELQRELKRLRTQRRRLRVEQKAPVGARVLEALVKSAPSLTAVPQRPPGVRLYEVNISVEQGQFNRRTELIAEMM